MRRLGALLTTATPCLSGAPGRLYRLRGGWPSEWGIEGQFRGFVPYLVNSEEVSKIFDVISGMLYLGRVTW